MIAAACQRAGTDVTHLGDAEASGLVRIEAGGWTSPIPSSAAWCTPKRGRPNVAPPTPPSPRRWDMTTTAGPGIERRPRSAPTRRWRPLERVGGQAVARRAYAAGAGALERAARLTPDPDTAGRRLISAGQAAAGAGLADRALTLLAEAAEVSGAEDQRARALRRRGRMQVWRGRPAEATPAWSSRPICVASRLAGAGGARCRRRRQRRHHHQLLLRGRTAGPAGRRPARRELRAIPGPARPRSGARRCSAGPCPARKAPEARPVLAEAFRLADGLDRLGPDWPWVHILLRTVSRSGSSSRREPRTPNCAGALRKRVPWPRMSAAGLLVADAAFRLGDWEAADAAALQTFQLAEDVGHRHMAGWALTIRTRILAAQGRCEESRAAAATALAIAESDRISTGLRFVRGALGFLELGLDRIDAAICELEAVEQVTQGSGHEEPVIVPWIPDLVEAYARQGREHDARRVLARLERQAVCSASPVAAASAARCRGLLDDDFDAAFAGALAFDDRRPMPFERARTLLAFGRRLNGACRRAAARQHLRAALEGFERLHAGAWARQAEAELRAAGGRHRPPAQDDGALTSQERRVAAAVRRGASNRDIAADLFLSPKTVEFHLRQIYRKLDVRSRTQLVAVLADRPETARSSRSSRS